MTSDYGAQAGPTVGGGIDPNNPFGGLDPTAILKDQRLAGLVAILPALAQLLQASQGQGATVPAPTADIAAEQRARAQAEAQSIPGNIYPGTGSGGPWDVLNSWSGMVGGPSVAPPVSGVNRVAMPSMTDALDLARQTAEAAQRPPAVESSPISDAIKATLAEVMGYINPPKTDAALAPDTSGGTGMRSPDISKGQSTVPGKDITSSIANTANDIGMQTRRATEAASRKNPSKFLSEAEKAGYAAPKGQERGNSRGNKNEPAITGRQSGGVVGPSKSPNMPAYKDGGSTPGPALLHVGERNPKDKNYETSEVVMAAPGTVVAPIPKGMPVTPENAMALILAQLLKTQGATDDHMPENSAAGSVTTPFGMQDLLNLLTGTTNAVGGLADTRQKQRQLALDTELGRGNLDLARMKLAQSDPRGNVNPGSTTEAQRNRGDAFLQNTRNYYSSQNAANQNDALGWARLGLDTELGRGGLAARNAEAANQSNYWQRGLDIENANNQFNQLTRGVGESSLPGVRIGRMPSFG